MNAHIQQQYKPTKYQHFVRQLRNLGLKLSEPSFKAERKDYEMARKLYRLAASVAILLGAAQASAIPFNAFDARSMAMGGTGVATAGSDSAALFNPALLSIARYSDDFTLILPAVGFHVADPEELAGSIDKFQNGNYVNTLQSSIEALNLAITTATNTPSVPNITAVGASAATVATNLSNLSTQIDTLSNKPLVMAGNLSTVIGIPNKKFGIAFYANSSIATGASFQYKDGTLLTSLATLSSCIATAATNVDPVAAAAAITACGTPTFTGNSLQSSVSVRGVMLREVGFAISKEYRIYGQNTAVGISPKIIQAQLFNVPIGINSPSLSNFNENDYKALYNIPNFDLGIAQNYRTGWRSGLVIKNVVPYFLDFKRAPIPGATPVASGETLRLIPQVRAGISHTDKWSVVALDMDLYRNDTVGLEDRTQYIALGGELNAWNAAQIRAGYRADLVNSARNIVSLGLGFSPFGLHTDIAVAGNASEIGLAFQLGFRF